MTTKNIKYEHNYSWTVVGAGPAGIAAVGILLDLEITNILWIDDNNFQGGKIKDWKDVSSNTKVSLFHKFFKNCKSFEYDLNQELFSMKYLDPDGFCELQYVSEILVITSAILKAKVSSISGRVNRIFSNDCLNGWNLDITKTDHLEPNITIHSNKVLLTIGSKPKILDVSMFFQNNEAISIPSVIPLERALNRNLLAQSIQSHDRIAIFGSSHSAIMIIRDILQFSLENIHIINFYRSPLLFAEYLPGGGGIKNDSTGLKGQTALWAKANLVDRCIDHLTRVEGTPMNMQSFLPICNKMIFAVGFEPAHILIDDVSTSHDFPYDSSTGVLRHNLYGAGIAFPEYAHDGAGLLEYRVGMWKFMTFLDRMIPVWISDERRIQSKL